MLLNVIKNVKTPVLMYDEEKDVVKKALIEYKYKLESEMRGKWGGRMQIVIDIPEEMWEWLHNGFLDEDDGKHAINAIIKGKPLPKGHGDLIDRDDLLADSYCIDDWSGNEINIVDVMTVKMADTIIEADKEWANGK